jgi:hypothetical protein
MQTLIQVSLISIKAGQRRRGTPRTSGGSPGAARLFSHSLFMDFDRFGHQAVE